MTSTNIKIKNLQHMHNFAEMVATLLRPNDFVALKGDLGVGKSTFVRAAIQNLMQDRDLIVPSPTFTLLQSYDAEQTKIVHADFYRLSDIEELDIIGWWSEIEDAIIFVEWPDKISSAIPANVIVLEIEDGLSEFERDISLTTTNTAFLERFATYSSIET